MYIQKVHFDSQGEGEDSIQEISEGVDGEREYKLAILVREKDTQEPIRNIKVNIKELDKEVATDENGKISLENLPKGKYTLSLVGKVQAAEQVIDVSGDEEEFDVVINVEDSLLSTENWLTIIVAVILLNFGWIKWFRPLAKMKKTI